MVQQRYTFVFEFMTHNSHFKTTYLNIFARDLCFWSLESRADARCFNNEAFKHNSVSRFCRHCIAVDVSVCVTASHYAALLFPHSPGAVRDLARNAELANIVAHFVEENSK